MNRIGEMSDEKLDCIRYYKHVGGGRLKLLDEVIGDFSADTAESIWTLFEEGVAEEHTVAKFRRKPTKFFFTLDIGSH
jgi:hypothetical protein